MTRRDSVLNDKIRMALRALTKAQSCENSVKTCVAKTASLEGEVTFKAVSPKYLKSTQSDLASRRSKSALTKERKVSQPTKKFTEASSELLSCVAVVVSGEITDPELLATLEDLAVQDGETDSKNNKMDHPHYAKEEKTR